MMLIIAGIESADDQARDKARYASLSRIVASEELSKLGEGKIVAGLGIVVGCVA